MSAERNSATFQENPFRAMKECHRRIEFFLHIIIRVKREAQGGPLTDEQRAALAAAIHFFQEGASWHVLDEEESLYPRIRLASRSESDSTLQDLEGLELEHAVLAVCHRELHLYGHRWMCDGELSREDFQHFTERLRKLSAIYHRHLREEDTILFPMAARVLREPEIRSIGREMAARREVPFVNEMLTNP